MRATTDVWSAYGRAVLGIAIMGVAVVVVTEIGKMGRRGRRAGQIFWWTVVKIRGWSVYICVCGGVCVCVWGGRLRTALGVVRAGRIFPTREGKLRHGPLCEDDEGTVSK